MDFIELKKFSMNEFNQEKSKKTSRKDTVNNNKKYHYYNNKIRLKYQLAIILLKKK